MLFTCPLGVSDIFTWFRPEGAARQGWHQLNSLHTPSLQVNYHSKGLNFKELGKSFSLFVMYPEFVVCNIAGNCITNAENSTIFYFKSVSKWQEEPTAHVRST